MRSQRQEHSPTHEGRRWQRAARAVATSVLAALGLATVAGAFSASWWVLDLIANLRLHLTIALILLTVVFVALRSWRVTVVSAVVAGVNLAVALPVLVPLLFGTPAPSAPAAAPLEVTFFNTKFRADRNLTIAHLEARDDDVVVLALAVGSWVEDLRSSRLGLHIHTGPDTELGEDLELVTMTRDPDTEVIVHRLSEDPRDAVVEIVVDHDGGSIHMLAAHPVSPVTRDRAARRDAMLAWLTDQARDRDAPVVVIGDLNATTWSSPLRELVREADLTDSRVGHGLQPSWPVDIGLFGLTIDHVLHSEEITTLDRQRTPIPGSDHPMIHARLSRRADGS